MSKSNDVNEYSNESGTRHVEGKKAKGKKDKKAKESGNEALEEENVVVVPPNGGWGWVVVLSAFYCNVVVDGIQLTFGIFLKAISKDLKAEYSQVALAGSLMFGIHLLMGPVTSGCNAVFGLRPVTITGSLICCFGVGISYFSTGFWYLYFSFGLIGGIGLGLVYMNTLIITSLYFTTLMPIAIAVVVCGTGIGTMVFAGVGIFLLELTTWRNSFLMQAILAGSMSVVAITFKPLKPKKVKIETSSKPTAEEEETGGASSSIRTSIFVKTEIPGRGSLASVRTYQNVAWSFAENVNMETEKKRRCARSKCCRKRRPRSEEKEILVLREIKSDGSQAHRRSYMEKNEMEEEEEIVRSERLKSSVSYKTIYTRIDKKKEKTRRRFWRTMKHTFVVMLDCRLLTSCSFFIFTVSGAISLAAFLIVFIYEKDRCEEDFGFSEKTSVYFIIALGGVNVFWRLVLGGIAVLPKIHYWALAISGMTLGGIATMVSGYSSSIYFQFAFCFVFGLAMASFAVFRIPLLIDMVGIEFIENATGINLLFMGLFCITFPPVFGWIKEISKSYNVIFLITGSLIVVSSLALIRLKSVDMNKIRNKNTCRSAR